MSLCWYEVCTIRWKREKREEGRASEEVQSEVVGEEWRGNDWAHARQRGMSRRNERNEPALGRADSIGREAKKAKRDGRWGRSEGRELAARKRADESGRVGGEWIRRVGKDERGESLRGGKGISRSTLPFSPVWDASVERSVARALPLRLSSSSRIQSPLIHERAAWRCLSVPVTSWPPCVP